MKLLLGIIVIILLFLIKIGDTVLFIARTLLTTVERINSMLFSAGKQLIVFIRSILLWVKTILFTLTKKGLLFLMVFFLSLYTHWVKRIKIPSIHVSSIASSHPSHIRKHRKKKESRFTSFSLLSKFKYFTAGGVFSLVFIFIPLLAIIFLQDLPNPKELSLRQIPQTTKIYDRNATLLYQIYASQNRTLVPLSDIPVSLQQATIAIEDKDFYKHPGFDVTAIIRSAWVNFSGKSLQGGSTITQQLIKSALLSPETSINRKVKEIILAFWAERMYTKNQILEMYFNQVPYGGTAWGIEAASEVYFGKHVRDLTLSESAFLAGIPRAPTIYSPYGTTPTLWKKRQKEVLSRMVSLGYISNIQAKEAEQEELSFRSPQVPIHAPHFVLYIKDLLTKKYGLPIVEKGGLTVITSLDLKLQEKVQRIVTEEITNNEALHVTNGAALVTNPTNGDILTMVGSTDYSNPNGGNVNLTTALRQPGSSIKVVTYAAAFSKGFTAASILDDSPVTYTSYGAPSYSPVNYDGRFHGRVPLRIAFGNSFNIPAVKTLNQIGIPTMVNLGKRMGIKTWGDPSAYGLSITLGAAEVPMVDMATVYGTVANGGVRIDLNPLLKISDYKGYVLEEKTPLQQDPLTAKQLGTRVLDEGIAFILSHILADNNARVWEFGLSSPLRISGHRVSVKTGTSDNKRDNWTIGYTDKYVTAVWVGNNDNSPMSPTLASGITGAAPIWNKIMTHLLANTTDTKLTLPSNVIKKACLGREEYFIRGTERLVNCVPLPTFTPTPKP